MSAIDLQSVDDYRKFALQQAGELVDQTSDYDHFSDETNGIKDLALINNIYRALYVGGVELDVSISEPFDWLKSYQPEIITVIAPYSIGTISLTQDSASVTLLTAPTGLGSLKNHFLKVDGIEHVYRIASHTADSTSATLDQIYLEATNATAGFKIIKLDYELTNEISRLWTALSVQRSQFDEDRVGEITYMEFRTFNQNFPLMDLYSGTPTNFTIVKEEQGKITIRFNRFPDTDKLRVEANYIPAPEHLVTFEFTADDVQDTIDKITEPYHGMRNGQIVRFTTSNALPAGILLDTDYYVVEKTPTKFKISLIEGGTAVDITDTGTGTQVCASIPRLPKSHRMLLADYASYRILVDKSDPRSDHYMRAAQATLQAMVGASRRKKRRASKDRGRFIPRRDMGYSDRRYWYRLDWAYPSS